MVDLRKNPQYIVPIIAVPLFVLFVTIVALFGIEAMIYTTMVFLVLTTIILGYAVASIKTTYEEPSKSSRRISRDERIR